MKAPGKVIGAGAFPLHIGRPVRKPSEREVRLVLARDLSRDKSKPQGFDEVKFLLLLQLPLFEVAVDGSDGVQAAIERDARHNWRDAKFKSVAHLLDGPRSMA
jgi:hypothetical protein